MSLHLLPHSTPAVTPWEGDLDDNRFQSFARATGSEFKRIALRRLHELATITGAAIGMDPVRHAGIYPIDAVITTASGYRVIVLIHGCIDDGPLAGLRRVDTTQKVLATIYGLHAEQSLPCLVLTSHTPEPGSQAARLLSGAGRHVGSHLFDVVAMNADFAGIRRLQRLLAEQEPDADLDAPWRRTAAEQLDLFTPIGIDPVA